MSKKMWNKIFKNKSTKNSKNLAAANKVNKRCSIYEEYQQLNALLQQPETPPTDENGVNDAKIYENKNATNIEDTPVPAILASSTSSLAIGNASKQSKFSKVVNTLTLKRNQHHEQTQQQLPKTPKAAAIKGAGKISTKKKHDEPIVSNATPVDLTEEPDPKFVEELTPCYICQRSFNPLTLQKHVPICERAKAKKRKVFDSSRQRREGTELAAFLPRGFGLPQTLAAKNERSLSPNPQKLGSPKLSRKKSSEEFVRTTARSSLRKLSTSSLNSGPSTSQAAANSGKPMPGGFVRDRLRSSERGASKRSLTPMAEQCPYCERCFGVKAYDRHVEWCKEKAIQAAIKNQTPTSEQNKAKERWEARNKYRAPNLKTKRSQNREKYAGFTGDEADSIDSPRGLSVMSQSMTSSMTSDSNNFDYRQENNERLGETEMDLNLNLALTSEDDGNELDNRQISPERPKTLTKKMSKNAIKRNSNKDMLEEEEPHYSKQQELDRARLVDLGKTLTVVQPQGQPQGKPKSPTSRKSTPQAYEDYDSSSQVRRQAPNKKSVRPPPTPIEVKPKQLKVTASMPVLRGPRVSRQTSQTSINSMPLKAIHSTGTIVKPGKNSKQRTSITKAGEPMKALPLVKDNLTKATKEKEVKIIKAPPTGRKQTPEPEEDLILEPSKRLISAQLDKYDPFLSAKRQLEDLCSPSTPNDGKENSFKSPTKEISNSQNQIPQSQPSTPVTPLAPTKMSTSFTLSTSSTSNLKSTGPSTPTSLTANRLTNTTPKPGITASNFRRTSSLRGPRRSPLLSSRPLFTPSQRPTVQRGLSDEGPISTNFLKPEEYDEMPVRSACVNDAALTKSPRVVRRDTSLSNRKNNLKLDIKSPNAVQEPGTPNQPAPATVRNIAKTDSLAVFLKYETEAEKPQTTQLVVHSPQHTVTASTPLITKALKDKSNTLSKQNSAKNLTLESDIPKLLEQQIPKLPPATQHNQTAMEHNDASPQPQSNKPSQLRLEPIAQTKPLAAAVHPPKPSTPFTQLPLLDRAVNLHDLFGDSKSYGKNSSSTEFIDPKLINKCDNLPVNLTSLTGRKHSDSEGSTQEPRQHDSSSAHVEQPPISQLSKLMPLHNAELSTTESPKQTFNPPTNVTHAAHRSSAEGRNLLKRKMRLGRNQFLYDASPEADSCSADDEANRSSVEYEAQKTATPINKSKQMPPIVPPLPIFDDFDFEEFLSSFAHDDEQFPLFKDCKDFLLNRTSSKLRSTLTSNSNANSNFHQQNNNNNNNNNNINSRCKTSPSILINQQHHQQQQQRENQQFQQSQQYQQYQQHHTHFQFPHLHTKPTDCPTFLLTPSSLRSNTTIISRGPPKLPNTVDVADQAAHNKREIFISIETEQQELGHSPISPDSLRQMVGNSQTEVEVEVDGNDNKFSKISDDEPLVSTPHLPNVELNNAKNLIQKMQDGFRQTVVTNNAITASKNNNNNSTNAMLFGGHDSGINTSTKTDAADDSDEMSSLDGYPIVGKSNRRGVASKLSADSAYGSLSRQRSTDNSTPRSLTRSRPATTASPQTQHQQQHQAPPGFTSKYSNMKARSRQFTKDSSSSGSDRSLPPIGGGGDGPQNFRRFDRANNNHSRQSPSPTPEVPRERTNSLSLSGGMAHMDTLNSNNSTSSSTMSSSAKLSKFCHECGGKYIIERAKFCTDCGVRRIVL